MFVLLLWLAFLDFQHFTATTGGIEKQFVVAEFTESALTGCATNPQSGSFGNDPITVNGNELPKFATDNPATWALPISGIGNESGITTTMVVPPDGQSFPMIPDPSLPSAPVVPEPPTVAILGITAAMLIALLFGRHYGRKLFRRI